MIRLLVAMQLMLLLREEGIADRELMAINVPSDWHSVGVDRPLLNCVAPLFCIWCLLNHRHGEGGDKA